MIRAILFPLGVAVFFGAVVLVVLMPSAGLYFENLATWRTEARQSPEGEATGALFEAAVRDNVIAWNPTQKSVDMQVRPNMTEELQTELFDIDEEGSVIRTELNRANALSKYIALRVRRPDCQPPCDREVPWSILAGTHEENRATQLALGAARIDGPDGIPEPLPHLHIQLWRGAGGNYSDWLAWKAHGTLIFELDDSAVDQVDIIGRLDETAELTGWKVAQRWCRDKEMRLSTCRQSELPTPLEEDSGQTTTVPTDFEETADTLTEDVAEGDEWDTAPAAPLQIIEADAYRLIRIEGVEVEPLRVHVSPLSVLPANDYDGTIRLTEYVFLECQLSAGCEPVWKPNRIQRRYSVFPKPNDQDVSPDGNPPEVPDLVADWAEPIIGANGQFLGFASTDAVLKIGAGPLIGGVRGPSGHMLDGIKDLDVGGSVRISLDADIQSVLHKVFQAMINPERPGSSELIRQLEYKLPAGPAEASMVVIDLSEGDTRGAILAAVGSPEPKLDLSRWDYVTASVDPSSSMPPGPAAWTGRGSQHVPGSAWKMMTSLALIDAATDPLLPQTVRQQIAQILTGLDRSESDRILGDRVLYGFGGLCVPINMATGLRGTNKRVIGSDGRECPDGYFGRSIKDSGSGGPLLLSNRRDFTFGLTAAMQRSSNIWFAAALLHVEKLRLEWRNRSVTGPFGDGPGRLGDGLAQTLEDLGLDRPLPLDGRRGLSMLPRDPASVEAFQEGASLRALASAAFGQQVQAGPLILAQLAGSIRTNQLIVPSLFHPLPPHKRLVRIGADSEALLGQLRLGMQRVVLDNGTGEKAFKRNADELRRSLRIGGKTGTAVRVLGSDERLSTFAGWLDDNKNEPRFAIACSAGVQGVRKGEDELAVPAICAYAVAALMRELEAADLVSK